MAAAMQHASTMWMPTSTSGRPSLACVRPTAIWMSSMPNRMMVNWRNRALGAASTSSTVIPNVAYAGQLCTC